MNKIFINGLLFSLLLTLSSCHTKEHKWDKDKFLKLQNKDVTVPIKHVEKINEFFSYQSKENGSFLVSQVWKKGKELSCQNCHEGNRLKDMKRRGIRRSHWQIILQHAPQEQMNCQTCHAGNHVWNFKNGNSEVDVNHSIKLCSQCHFKQKRDWEIGAHGKRAKGWQYQRAVFHCVSCHNPHNPGLKKRWPSINPYRVKE